MLYLVPNFHPACMGWLTRYSEERNYCLYSYLAHLDRVAKDPAYKFAFSEWPHLVTMMEYEPARITEFRERVREGRIECVNSFVLEPTVSLSGGEALVQQGVQGLRWYKGVMDIRPRFCWMIDTCGWHEQMAQIIVGLDLEAFVYCRYNPTGTAANPPHKRDSDSRGTAIHWIQSPDGTRALALNPGHYAHPEYRVLFNKQGPLSPGQLEEMIAKSKTAESRFPKGMPMLILGGGGDYSLPFPYDKYPTELTATWNKESPDLQLRIATPGEYLDAILPGVRSGQYPIPTVTSGSAVYGWTSFWVNMPIIKQWYRRAEHALQAAEALATTASVHGAAPYPAQDFANAWVQMCLNMDRNVLWGVSVDSSFLDKESWDTRDRFESVQATVAKANAASFDRLTTPANQGITLFNPVNWTRTAPTELRLPASTVVADVACQAAEDGETVLADLPLPSLGVTGGKLEWAGSHSTASTELPHAIETPYYKARIDADTGALVSLKLKADGRELLGGPANVVLAEEKGEEHNIPAKAMRKLLTSSSASRPFMTVTRGPLATIVEIRSSFHGQRELRRVVRFYETSPRIDFVTETNGLPEGTVVSVEFPLAEEVTEMRRGIPYGFSYGNCIEDIPGVTGLTKGILPAIRWSDYALKNGGGLAILDRGVSGRELVGQTAFLLLHNVCETYLKFPASWMGDKRKQTYAYAILPHAESWDRANIARQAFEYNSPVLAASGRLAGESASCVQTSDNVIVEAMRRVDACIELRLVECIGKTGQAWVQVDLPHTAAVMTNLTGEKPIALSNGPRYSFAVRPQQIITLRLTTRDAVDTAHALRTFDSVIPEDKREFMRQARNPKLIGHPPRKD